MSNLAQRPILLVLALASLLVTAGLWTGAPTVGAQDGDGSSGNDTDDDETDDATDTPTSGTPDLHKELVNRNASGDWSTRAAAEPGDIVEVRLNYTSRNGTTSNITVNDKVPEHTRLVACTGECSAEPGAGPGTSLTWSYTDAAANQTIEQSVELQVLHDAGTTSLDVGAPATVTTNQTLGTTASNGVTLTVTAPTTPLDLAVRNTAEDLASGFADTYLVRAGDPVTYRLVYNNTGDETAENLTLATEVPDHARLVGCSANCTTQGDDGAGTNLTWSVGDLPSGQRFEATMDLDLNTSFPAGTTPVTVSAWASHVNETGNLANTSVPVTLEVTAATNSSLGLTVAPNGSEATGVEALETEPGANLTYRLTYTNSGNATATGVTLQDAVVDNATLSACPDPCQPNGDGGPETPLRWSLGDVAGGSDPVEVSFSVQLDETFPPGTTTLTNDARAISDQEDALRSNRVEVNVTAEGAAGAPEDGCPPEDGSQTQDGASGNDTAAGNTSSEDAGAKDTDTCPEASDTAPDGNGTDQPPDLVAGNLTVDPSTPTPEDRITVHVTVTNRGGPFEVPARVSLRIDGREAAHQVLEGMAAEESQEVSFDPGWQAAQGTHRLAVLADSDMAIEESDELNNAASATVTVDAALEATEAPGTGDGQAPAGGNGSAGEQPGPFQTPGPGPMVVLAGLGSAALLLAGRCRR